MPARWLPIHSEIKSVLKANDELMLSGGAGSGKSHFMLNVIFKRALAVDGSRHLILRKRFEHMKNTIWNSAKEHILLEWGEALWGKLITNRSGGTWSIDFDNGSSVIFGGADDGERLEKILGFEAATIYINEASEFHDERDIELISSRLRQKVACRHLFLLDQNPASKKHWSYRRYIIEPQEGRGFFKINPIDVRENLPNGYIERLERLPDRLRQRFLHGEFVSDVEGALWSWEMLEGIKHDKDDFIRVVVGVDPAVTSNPDSDETGIVVVGLTSRETAHVIADYSGRYKPSEWAQKVADAYDLHRADAVVAETNQGGDLVENNLKNHHQGMKIKQVKATRGKHVRAEPVAALYEQNKITHAFKLEDLEGQMLDWVPGVGPSPDRVDALVWALTELLINRPPQISFGVV